MRRKRRVAAGALLALAIVLVPVLCLRLPFARRAVATNVNRVLAQTFVGHVVVDKIGAIGVTLVEGVDAHVETTDGERVLRVEGLRARVSTWTLVRSLLGHGDIVVNLPEVSFRSVEGTISPDERGALRIADAFELRSDRPRGEAPRGVRVRLAHVLLQGGAIHVQPNAMAPLDVDLDGAEANVVFDGGKIAVNVTRAPLVVRGLPGGAQAVGLLEGRVSQSPLHVKAHWRGAVGAIHDEADFSYNDGRVNAKLDVARATPEQMRAVWSECPLLASTDAHAEAHGQLPRLDVAVHAGLGVGALDVTGAVEVGAPLRANLHLEARSFDVGAVLPSAPATEVEASGDVTISARPLGAVDGRASVELTRGLLGSTPLPAAALQAEFARSDSGEPSGHAELTIQAPFAPTVVTAQLARRPAQRGGSLVLTFQGQSSAARLEDVPMLGAVASGSATARATGTLDLTAKAINAQLAVAADDLAVRGVSVDHASMTVHASRTVNAPSLDVEVDGEGLDAGAVRLSAVRGQWKMAIERGAALKDVDLEVTGDAAPAHVHAGSVQISAEGLRVDDAKLEGLGAPLAATLRASQSAVVVKAETAGIDLAKLHTFARTAVSRGTLSVDIDATVGAAAAEGRLALALQHAAFGGINDASARLEAVVHGRHASGRATASVEDIARVEVSTPSVDIGPGPLLTPSPWRKTWGAVNFGAHVDLARLAARSPPREVPPDDVAGLLEIEGRVSRDAMDDATPGVDVTAHTTGLVVTGQRGHHRWRTEGVNPTVHATVDGNTGRTALDVQLRDAAGAIATLDANSDGVPYAVLFSDEDPIDALRNMPFDAQLRLPLRSVASLPPALGLDGFGGDMQASVTWHGAVVNPTIDLAATITGGRAASALLARSLDFSVGGHYDGSRLDATVRAMMRGQEVLDTSARVEARAADVLAGFSGESVPWKASARAKLDRLPLQTVTAMADRQVRGKVSGEVVVEGLHEDARANLALVIEGLKVGDVAGRSSNVKVTIDGRSLEASARLDQEDGFIEGRSRMGIRWGAAVVPAIDPSQPIEGSLSAKQFRAAFLLPLVSRWLTELDGQIDADVSVATSGDGANVRPQGTIAFHGGTFELLTFGGQFRGASATLVITPDGVLRLQNAVAHGTSGSVQAAATARLDGTSLSSVRANVVLPQKDPLPLVFDGVKLGMLSGGFDISAARAAGGRGLDLTVDATAAHVQLTSDPTSVDVQGLGDLPGVKVGVLRNARDFVEVPLDGPRVETGERSATSQSGMRATLRLRDVEVSRGTDLDVRLEGQPTITMGAVTQVTGQIRLSRGSIDVYGKPFTIDRGTVTFVGDDPSNPQVVLTASWAAPDGATRIYADFVGPLKTGKVRLRSEPAKPQSEILALVLFGTTDDQKTSAGGTSAQVSPAAAVAGGAAAQPINRALGGLDRALDNLGLAGGISTKVDTSQTTPRPEVEVQIARDISLQIAWVLGAPPPGTNPDSTLVTLDWQFLRKWSLETTVGDMGTSILDVVWQHRY